MLWGPAHEVCNKPERGESSNFEPTPSTEKVEKQVGNREKRKLFFHRISLNSHPAIEASEQISFDCLL
jgi:hypothetical protein